VRNFLKQLVFQLDDVPEALEFAYDRFIQDGMEPENASFVTFLRDCFQQFTSVFLFLDALDECDKQEKPHLMEALHQIPKSRLRLFLTVRRNDPVTDLEYRHDPHLKRWLQQGSTLVITARTADIETYVTTKLERRGEDPERSRRIVTAISSRAAGR
jgi:hypothetical protein